MRARAITSSVVTATATVTAALALTACGSSNAAPVASTPTATTKAAAVGRPGPITSLGLRSGDLPSTFVATDSEPVLTPALDAKLRRCLAQPLAPRATGSHQTGWDRDRRRQDSAVLTTAMRYADQDSATRYTGVADSPRSAACFDTVLTRAFQGTGEDYVRIAPHSADVRKRTSAEPSNVTAVITYRFRSAPPAGIDPSYGRIDIYYLAGPRVGAALTYVAFDEAPDAGVRNRGLTTFAARVARG